MADAKSLKQLELLSLVNALTKELVNHTGLSGEYNLRLCHSTFLFKLWKEPTADLGRRLRFLSVIINNNNNNENHQIALWQSS